MHQPCTHAMTGNARTLACCTAACRAISKKMLYTNAARTESDRARVRAHDTDTKRPPLINDYRSLGKLDGCQPD